MCGIAGFASRNTPEALDVAVRAMTKSLARRGPDSQGLHRWPHAMFGHRRLAILDLSPAGHQPMMTEDESVGVVFNGCIYNFAELRQELEGEGQRFRSQCDTEVLIRGYKAWGADKLVRRLRGMYAFGIWDEPQQKLTLVRDRLGVKPLVFASTPGGGLAFASTVSALRSAGFGGELNRQAILEYLEFGFISEQHCVYEGLQKLAPGTVLEWQNGQTRSWSYWQLPETEHSSITFEEAVEETERLLIEAVKLRLQADVSIAVLLSGGVDSSLVCWALSKLNANIQSFTVAVPGSGVDEGPRAALTAQKLGIPNRQVTVEEAEGDILDELLTAYSEPFGCSSALGILQVSRAIKPHATVLLTGDGGDEVYLGYPFFQSFWRATQLARALPGFSAPLWNSVRPMVDAAPPLRRFKHLMDYATGGLGAVTRVRNGLPYYERQGLLGERLSSLRLPQRNIARSMDSARQLLPEALEYHRRLWLPSEFLVKVDGGTMHYALEARAPFLDQVLWEFAWKIPASVRLQGGKLKAILRHIAGNRIDPELAYGRKQGFTIPVENWLTTRWGGALKELARDSELAAQGWVSPANLAKTIHEVSASNEAPQQLWYLLVLEHWLRRHSGRVEAAA
jgi:asparagine synthase (glutamine-hydrolysing)